MGIAEGVYIFTHFDLEHDHTIREYKPVILEDYSKIYSRCTILPGITIEKQAIVGAEEAAKRFSANGGVPYDVILKPAYSQAYNTNMAAILAWLKHENDDVIAGASSSLNIEVVQDIVKNIKYGKKGYGMLIAEDGTFIVHPDKDVAMKKALIL